MSTLYLQLPQAKNFVFRQSVLHAVKTFALVFKRTFQQLFSISLSRSLSCVWERYYLMCVFSCIWFCEFINNLLSSQVSICSFRIISGCNWRSQSANQVLATHQPRQIETFWILYVVKMKREMWVGKKISRKFVQKCNQPIKRNERKVNRKVGFTILMCLMRLFF